MKQRTVDDIPLLLKPLYLIWAYLSAALIYGQLRFLEHITRIEYINKVQLIRTPSHILCVWHEDLTLFFLSHRKFASAHIWMSYPLWYMKPIHIIKRWMGIREIAYGASGIGGQQALALILERLRGGWSSFITPDGPKGPLREIKDGVLQMSLQTGTPVIPVSFELDREFRIYSWDRKRYPKLGARLKVIYGSPVLVSEKNYELSRQQIRNGMTIFH